MNQLRSMPAAVAVASLLLTACGGGGDGDFPGDSLQINGGAVEPVTLVDIQGGSGPDIRVITVFSSGSSIQFAFAGFNSMDWFPVGTWTAMDTSFTGMTVSHGGGPVSFDSSSTHHGSLTISGADPSISLDADFTLASGGIDRIRVKYSGAFVHP